MGQKEESTHLGDGFGAKVVREGLFRYDELDQERSNETLSSITLPFRRGAHFSELMQLDLTCVSLSCFLPTSAFIE